MRRYDINVCNLGQGYGHNYGVHGSKSKFGCGDVIGMGIEYPLFTADGFEAQELTVFYTKNGENLGPAYEVPFQTWYGCIGIDSYDIIEINFGDKPFVFDIEGYDAEKFNAYRPPDAVERILALEYTNYFHIIQDNVEDFYYYHRGDSDDDYIMNDFTAPEEVLEYFHPIFRGQDEDEDDDYEVVNDYGHDDDDDDDDDEQYYMEDVHSNDDSHVDD